MQSSTDKQKSPSLLLVSMPWASVRRPNLGLSTLAAQVRRAGFECAIYYPCIELACDLGIEAFETLANTTSLFGVCEHLFSLRLFDAEALRSDEIFAHYTLENGTNVFREISEKFIDPMLDRTVSHILKNAPTIVGFGCTFNQTLPSLAVAARLKRACPEMTIIFGGASVQANMGLALSRAFPHLIDHVFLGEADHTLPAFLKCIQAGLDPRTVSGVTVHGEPTAEPAPINDLDSLAIPEFEDYFDQIEHCRLPRSIIEAIPFESSRGCWWGQKHHCTFCGLNGDGISYRRKSSTRVIEEIVSLAHATQVTDLMAADNVMPHEFWTSVLPELAKQPLDLSLFYEIKANLNRDQAALLSRSGLTNVQPGIESFSTHVLKLMRKGLTALQNVFFLKLCKEFNINPIYNILVGFPGETKADYLTMAALMRKISHLHPPSGLGSLLDIHRFSPFFTTPQQLGIDAIQPHWTYAHLIPAEIITPEDYAYFFNRPNAQEKYAEHLAIVRETLEFWHGAKHHIRARLGVGFIEIIDSRSEHVSLSIAASAALIAADRPIRHNELLARIKAYSNDPDSVLANLISYDWLVQDEEYVLSTVPFDKPHSTADLLSWSQEWMPYSDTDNNGFI